MSRGRLWLVPNALDLGSETVDIQDVLALGVLTQAAQIQHWVVENAKTSRAFLKRVAAVTPLVCPLQEMHIVELPRPPKDGSPAPDSRQMTALLAPALAGADIGLLSEAGLPAVADPGANLVAVAHAAGLAVMPMSGPSALTLALAASGLNGQSFAFVGYLPANDPARMQRLRELEQRSRREQQTQIAIETPYRNEALMAALLAHLAPGTRLCVACGLTLAGGWCRTLSVEQWRTAPPSIDRKLPTVFLWLAN